MAGWVFQVVVLGKPVPADTIENERAEHDHDQVSLKLMCASMIRIKSRLSFTTPTTYAPDCRGHESGRSRFDKAVTRESSVYISPGVIRSIQR